MRDEIYIVKIIQTGNAANASGLWASFDKEAMELKAKEMNALMVEKGYQNARYEMEEVRFLPELITEDDF